MCPSFSKCFHSGLPPNLLNQVGSLAQPVAQPSTFPLLISFPPASTPHFPLRPMIVKCTYKNCCCGAEEKKSIQD